jgi:RND superfamily putative drug exporter
VTGLLYRMGRTCSRHHWLTIAVWVIAVIALALGSRAAGEQTSDNLTLPGTGSTNAQNLLKDRLPQQAYGTNPIVLESTKGRLDKGDNAKAVKQTVKSVKKAPHVTAAVSPNSKAGKAALSKDGKIAYISVTLDEGPSDLTERPRRSSMQPIPRATPGSTSRRAATSDRPFRSRRRRAARSWGSPLP